jgi:hypothetical protein
VKICLGKGYGCQRVLTEIGKELYKGDPTIAGPWKTLCCHLPISAWYVDDNHACWIYVDPKDLRQCLGVSDEEFTAFLLENA